MSGRNLTNRRPAYMATTAERLGIVETKVHNLDEKIDHLKSDVKDVHDCLDRTGDELKQQLQTMHDDSCRQHNELAGKISELEKFRLKWTYMIAGAIAVLGIMSGHFEKIETFFK
jgi:polyhydroxyalkanoate synthesis regulator phasin